MYVRCDESSLYSWINYVQPHGELSGGVSGNNCNDAQGLAYTYCIMPTPVLTRKKPDVMI